MSQNFFLVFSFQPGILTAYLALPGLTDRQSAIYNHLISNGDIRERYTGT